MCEHEIHTWLNPIGEALQLSVFVMIIMILMEYISLRSKKKEREIGKTNKTWIQVLMGGLIGCIPGCVGGFAAMSFYSHGIWSFGAVLAASFSALGDDAFRLSAMMPRIYILITLLLLVLGFTVGILVDKIPYFATLRTNSCGHIHSHNEDKVKDGKHFSIKWRDKVWSLERVLLVVVLLFYMYILLFGGHTHGDILLGEHNHGHTHGIGEWIFENGLFLVISIIALWIIIIADDHFIEHHLWKHVLKEHFLSIFLWTLCTLYILVFWTEFVSPMGINIGATELSIILLIGAILIGWIPYSGPHFLFIQLFASSAIPFSVLLVNSIVQDGHTSLVMISESRKQFCWLKGIKSIIALSVGIIGIVVGF